MVVVCTALEDRGGFRTSVDKAPVESTGDWSFMDVNGSLVGC